MALTFMRFSLLRTFAQYRPCIEHFWGMLWQNSWSCVIWTMRSILHWGVCNMDHLWCLKKSHCTVLLTGIHFDYVCFNSGALHVPYLSMLYNTSRQDSSSEIAFGLTWSILQAFPLNLWSVKRRGSLMHWKELFPVCLQMLFICWHISEMWNDCSTDLKCLRSWRRIFCDHIWMRKGRF